MLARTHRCAASTSRTTNTDGRARIFGSKRGSCECRYPQTTSVRLPSPPWRNTGHVVHGGGASNEKIGTLSDVASHLVLVAVGQHDHVAFVRPMALSVGT